MEHLGKRSRLNRRQSSSKPDNSPEDKITPEYLFLSRRKFIAGMGTVAASALLAACAPKTQGTPSEPKTEFCIDATTDGTADDLGDELTTCDDVTNYNNFYEFSYSKEAVAVLARDFETSPWTVNVGGLVDKPGSFTIDELIAKYKPEERIYRLRCVEAWSMVIPWLAFPLSRLLEDAQPQPDATFVRFQSLWDPQQMPGDTSLPFPYYEGLRLDEAMQDLTVLATGVYGKPLPPQCGAPIRLVVPWKYGFKSAKSLLNIELMAGMPQTFWPRVSPGEYGFYANVNPNVDHPRWSQSSERRIGEFGRRPTLMFNGYDEVAPLYEGMDLRKFY